MVPETAATAVSALAAAIANCVPPDQIDVLAAVFTQLGDTLATISVLREKQEGAALEPKNDRKALPET